MADVKQLIDELQGQYDIDMVRNPYAKQTVVARNSIPRIIALLKAGERMYENSSFIEGHQHLDMAKAAWREAGEVK